MLPNFPVVKLEIPTVSGVVQIDWEANLQILGWTAHEPWTKYDLALNGPIRRTDRIINHDRERNLQTLWCERQNFRSFLGNRDAPVLTVGGNHDFIDIGQYIGGEVYEIDRHLADQVFHVAGLKFGGFRGINYIEGEWDLELRKFEMEKKTEQLPNDIDYLVTHSPPHGILDYGSGHYGAQAIRQYIERRNYSEKPLKAHFFGHVHERHGSTKMGDTLFSNAATTYILYDL